MATYKPADVSTIYFLEYSIFTEAWLYRLAVLTCASRPLLLSSWSVVGGMVVDPRRPEPLERGDSGSSELYCSTRRRDEMS